MIKFLPIPKISKNILEEKQKQPIADLIHILPFPWNPPDNNDALPRLPPPPRKRLPPIRSRPTPPVNNKPPPPDPKPTPPSAPTPTDPDPDPVENIVCGNSDTSLVRNVSIEGGVSYTFDKATALQLAIAGDTSLQDEVVSQCPGAVTIDDVTLECLPDNNISIGFPLVVQGSGSCQAVQQQIIEDNTIEGYPEPEFFVDNIVVSYDFATSSTASDISDLSCFATFGDLSSPLTEYAQDFSEPMYVKYENGLGWIGGITDDTDTELRKNLTPAIAALGLSTPSRDNLISENSIKNVKGLAQQFCPMTIGSISSLANPNFINVYLSLDFSSIDDANIDYDVTSLQLLMTGTIKASIPESIFKKRGQKIRVATAGTTPIYAYTTQNIISEEIIADFSISNSYNKPLGSSNPWITVNPIKVQTYNKDRVQLTNITITVIPTP